MVSSILPGLAPFHLFKIMMLTGKKRSPIFELEYTSDPCINFRWLQILTKPFGKGIAIFQNL